MKTSYKVAYIITREDLRAPLIKTQVVNVLKSISNRVNIKLLLIWFYRVDYLFRDRKSFLELYNQMNYSGIKVVKIPIIVSKFPINMFFLPLLMLQVIVGILLVKIFFRVQIFHGRAYYSGLALAIIRKILGERIKCVFDPRSPYPDEIIIAYGVKKNSFYAKLWTWLEGFIVRHSDFTIGVSRPFCKYLRSRGGRVIFIPNNVNFRSKIQEKISHRNSICYVGSLGYGWNNVVTYVNFVKELTFKRKDIIFEFYVPSKFNKILRDELDKADVNTKRYIIENLSPDQVTTKLLGAIAGLQLMSSPDVRLGVKVVEYLAAGLPVITTPNAIGATDIVKKYGVGVCVEGYGDKVDQFIDSQINDRLFMYKKCRKLAKRMFSTSRVAIRYIRLYNALTFSN